MGTRSQVLIEDTGVYLYQHYDGYDLFKTVKEAVYSKAGQSRLNDEEYLTRIIFCHMVKDDVDGETGYGIGTDQHGDIEYLVKVNCNEGSIKNYKVGFSDELKLIDSASFKE